MLDLDLAAKDPFDPLTPSGKKKIEETLYEIGKRQLEDIKKNSTSGTLFSFKLFYNQDHDPVVVSLQGSNLILRRI